MAEYQSPGLYPRMPPGMYQYQFITRLKTVNGTVHVNTGGRPVTGPDVESAARSATYNFTDRIFVPAFGYQNTPRETIERERTMSACLWCDFDDPDTNFPHQIGHPFSSRDTGRKNMSFTEYDDDNQPQTIQGETCGYHSAMNPFLRKRAVAIEAADSVAKMEKQNADWQAGYDAALDRLARNTTVDNPPIKGSVEDVH